MDWYTALSEFVEAVDLLNPEPSTEVRIELDKDSLRTLRGQIELRRFPGLAERHYLLDSFMLRIGPVDVHFIGPPDYKQPLWSHWLKVDVCPRCGKRLEKVPDRDMYRCSKCIVQLGGGAMSRLRDDLKTHVARTIGWQLLHNLDIKEEA